MENNVILSVKILSARNKSSIFESSTHFQLNIKNKWKHVTLHKKYIYGGKLNVNIACIETNHSVRSISSINNLKINLRSICLTQLFSALSQFTLANDAPSESP